MSSLPNVLPSIYREFSSGRFVAHKTMRPFSAIALDQAHEQVNAMVKGDGGAVGLTGNASALRRWMIAGPELSRMIQEFEGKLADGDLRKHHQQISSYQVSACKEVKSMVAVLTDMGNPFAEDSGELLRLDTKDIMSAEVVQSVRNLQQIGQNQYEAFVQERLIDKSKSVFEPVKKNKLLLLSSKNMAPKKKGQVAVLQDDCSLFSRLYIACQSRDGNLTEFFKYENQPWPPALSKLGDLRDGNKSDLLHILEGPDRVGYERPPVDAILLDGAVIVHMLSPGTAKTFQEYTDNVFIPYVRRQLESTNRVDVIWDVYRVDSLKAEARERRGAGIRRRVLSASQIPRNWKSFLRVSENKSELFHFLAEEVSLIQVDGKEVYSTCGEHVLTSPHREDCDLLELCTHEEADTRIIVHLADAAQQGHRRVMVRTDDTDVVVLIVAHLHSLALAEVWVAFGLANHFRYIAAHNLAIQLGPQNSLGLLMFHSFTGCDTVSFFFGKGKKTAWETWNVYPEISSVFHELSSTPSSISEESLNKLERFVVLWYDRTSVLDGVNEARQQMFPSQRRALENIPPTKAALKQHILRAVHQAGYIWGQAAQKDPKIPSPAEWGWEKSSSNKWTPKWSELCQAQEACYELIHCGCKRACQGNCKCSRANLNCTSLCSCSGNCFDD